MTYDKEQFIVVTGGAGFIGSCLIRFLNDQGIDNIVVADDLGATDKWKNLIGKNFYGIISPANLFDWMKGKENAIDAIIHLGACSDTTEKDADYLLNNNTRFSIKLADIALQHQMRFIYASSAATYGDGKEGFSDDHDRLITLKPLNMYGYSKHLFDLWLLKNNLLNHVVGLKYFNVFGPNEAHKEKMASAIYHLYQKAKDDKRIQLFKSSHPDQFKDGEQKRDFIYIKDAVRITASFLYNEVGGIYNVGTGIASTWNQLGESLFEALNVEGTIEYREMPSELTGKYQNYTCADVSKLRGALSEAASCQPFKLSVKDYVQNYLLTGQAW